MENEKSWINDAKRKTEMNKEILTVVDVFEIKEKGVVLTGIVSVSSFELKQGDFIEIINPNGIKIQSLVQGIEKNTKQCFTVVPVTMVGILLDSSTSKTSVVSGAKIYSFNINT